MNGQKRRINDPGSNAERLEFAAARIHFEEVNPLALDDRWIILFEIDADGMGFFSGHG